MKKLILFSAVLALLVSLTALAQDTTKPSDDRAKQDNTKAPTQENQEKSASQTKTVTGCLAIGDQPDDFSITGEDGKTWELHSSTVKLADHVGHQVAVTGPVTRDAKAQEKKKDRLRRQPAKKSMGNCVSQT